MQGESRDNALEFARQAIAFHLECLAEEGALIPDDRALVYEHIEVAMTEVPTKATRTDN